VPISQLAKESESNFPNSQSHTLHPFTPQTIPLGSIPSTETEERRKKQRRKLHKLEHKKKKIPFSFALSRSKGTKTK
jgi:hypothetical protein